MNYPYAMNNRKSIRLPVYDYSSPGEYFITICVKDGICVLGEISQDDIILSNTGQVVLKWILQLRERYPLVEVNHYVIMPNHIHLIIEIKESLENPYVEEDFIQPNIRKRRKMLLSKAIGYFKMNSAKEINHLNYTSGSSFWQANYYEHIVRNVIEFNAIVAYINNNPLNWKIDMENLRRDNS